MSILDKIIKVKKEEVAELKKTYSKNSFEEMEFFNLPVLPFTDTLIKGERISIIAEIKQASPSKGIINKNFNPVTIAECYFGNGVDAVSVLTDKQFFNGNIEYLSQISKFKKTPLLRKDFIIDELQILESRAFGADIILLICESLTKSQINDLTDSALELGMEVLLELHSTDQLKKIDFNRNKLIGINNRNLNDFSISLSATKEISEKLPENVFIVSESGINTKKDVSFLKQTGADALLVGEFLMKGEIIKNLNELKKWCIRES